MPVLHGDSLTELKRFEDDSIDALVSDPPAGISFMGKAFDSPNLFREQMRPIFEECLRVLKPGGHGFVWALPRTSHWTATALEEAGFEIRDVVTHVFGSGFPKSHNVGNGWGSALKPAAEHWVLVRKPLEKGLSIAQNVSKWGTGAINIGASRIGCAPGDKTEFPVGYYGLTNFRTSMRTGDTSPNGRFPTNFVLSHSEECEERCVADCPVAELDRQSGDSRSQRALLRTGLSTQYVGGEAKPYVSVRGFDDVGGASRFFYCAKPSKSERNAGLDDFEEKKNMSLPDKGWSDNSNAFLCGGPAARKNSHPTVKATKLMKYLITMICPPAGTVLDPFAGSCTTGVAAIQTKREFIGIEKEEEYVEIGEARMREARGDNDPQNRCFE